MNHNSLIKKLVGQTAIYGLPAIVGRLLNYLLVPLYTYIFNTAEYGQVSIVYTFSALMAVLLTYGTETAFFRFANKNNNAESLTLQNQAQNINTNPKQIYATLGRGLLLTTAITTALLLLITKPIAAGLGIAQYPQFVTWILLILAADTITSLPFALLRFQNRPRYFALVRVVGIAVNILLNILFLVVLPKYANWQPHIKYIFLSNLAASVFTLLFLLPQIKAMFAASFNRQLWQTMLKYALPLIIVGLAGVSNMVLDRLLLRWLLPMPFAEEQVGIYAANYKLATLMALVTQAFRMAADPLFFSQANNKNSPVFYAKVTHLFTAGGALLFLAVTFCLPVLQYFVGPQFREGLKVVPLLIAANICLGIYYNFSVWYKLTDKTNAGAIITTIGSVVTLLINLWLIPIISYEGAAWATFLGYATMMLMAYIWGKRVYPVPYKILRMMGYAAVAFCVYWFSEKILPVWLANSSGYLQYILRIFVFMLITALFFIIEKKSK
ncbi:MAG: polysaccharide biosynthesis protein [Sphingobacteriales bacterium]|nr:polysaccharide biosynthesis protein [Sphingobacteriales bacterium]